MIAHLQSGTQFRLLQAGLVSPITMDDSFEVESVIERYRALGSYIPRFIVTVRMIEKSCIMSMSDDCAGSMPSGANAQATP